MRKLATSVAIGAASALLLAIPSPGTDAAGSCFGNPVTISGTPSGDTINGTPGDDVIHGLGGNDFISGGGGDDGQRALFNLFQSFAQAQARHIIRFDWRTI